MMNKHYLHKSIIWELGLLTYYLQAEGKKTGIHPITFEDQFGNKISRLYDYDLGQYAGGSSTPMNVELNKPISSALTTSKSSLAKEVAASSPIPLKTIKEDNGYIDINRVGGKNPSDELIINTSIYNTAHACEQSVNSPAFMPILQTKLDRRNFLDGVADAIDEVKGKWETSGIAKALTDIDNKVQNFITEKAPAIANVVYSPEFKRLLGKSVFAILGVSSIFIGGKNFVGAYSSIIKALKSGQINEQEMQALFVKSVGSTVRFLTGTFLVSLSLLAALKSYVERSRTTTSVKNNLDKDQSLNTLTEKAFADYKSIMELPDSEEKTKRLAMWEESIGEASKTIKEIYLAPEMPEKLYGILEDNFGYDPKKIWERVLASRNRDTKDPSYQDFEKRVIELTQLVQDESETDDPNHQARIAWRRKIIESELAYGELLDDFTEGNFNALLEKIKTNNTSKAQKIENPAYTPMDLGGYEPYEKGERSTQAKQVNDLQYTQGLINNELSDLYPLTTPVILTESGGRAFAESQKYSNTNLADSGITLNKGFSYYKKLFDRGIVSPVEGSEKPDGTFTVNLEQLNEKGAPIPWLDYSFINIGDAEQNHRKIKEHFDGEKIIRSQLISGNVKKVEYVSQKQSNEATLKHTTYHEYGHLIEQEQNMSSVSAEYLLERSVEATQSNLRNIELPSDYALEHDVSKTSQFLPIENNYYTGRTYSAVPDAVQNNQINTVFATELVSTTMETLSDYDLAKGLLESGERERMLYTLGVLTK